MAGSITRRFLLGCAFALACVMLLPPIPLKASAAFVQYTTAGSGGGSSCTTPNMTVTAGDVVALGIRTDVTSLTISSITDTFSGSYTQRAAINSQDPALYWYSTTLGSSGTFSVTANYSTATTYSWCIAVEISGVSGFDVADTRAESGRNDIISNPFTTAGAGIVLAEVSQSAVVAGYTAGTDFTLIDGNLNNGGGAPVDIGGAEYYVTSGALSSYTAHMTSPSTSGNATIAVVAFSASGGGVVVPCRLLLLGAGCGGD